MLTTKATAIAVLLMVPALMAPTCATNEARFTEPGKDTYCNEDVSVRAEVSTGERWEGLSYNAVLLRYSLQDGTAQVIGKTALASGGSAMMTTTIPWSALSDHRGELFVMAADIVLTSEESSALITAGSTITAEQYMAFLQNTPVTLLARATRSVYVCNVQ